jgi:hypothetical protein
VQPHVVPAAGGHVPDPCDQRAARRRDAVRRQEPTEVGVGIEDVNDAAPTLVGLDRLGKRNGVGGQQTKTFLDGLEMTAAVRPTPTELRAWLPCSMEPTPFRERRPRLSYTG